MLPSIATYVITAVIFVAIDALYLGTIGKKLFEATLGDVMGKIVVAPAILFYLIFPIGLLIFAIMPALASGRVTTALVYGALFGFFTYMTFDLTSFSIIRNWTTSLALADIAWGTVLCAATSAAVFFIHRAIFGA